MKFAQSFYYWNAIKQREKASLCGVAYSASEMMTCHCSTAMTSLTLTYHHQKKYVGDTAGQRA